MRKWERKGKRERRRVNRGKEGKFTANDGVERVGAFIVGVVVVPLHRRGMRHSEGESGEDECGKEEGG